jgi:hypothetical protein
VLFFRIIIVHLALYICCYCMLIDFTVHRGSSPGKIYVLTDVFRYPPAPPIHILVAVKLHQWQDPDTARPIVHCQHASCK